MIWFLGIFMGLFGWCWVVFFALFFFERVGIVGYIFVDVVFCFECVCVYFLIGVDKEGLFWYFGVRCISW